MKHGDTVTSPEEILFTGDNLQPGTWSTQVCPFPGGLVTDPADYTGTWATSSGPSAGFLGSVPAGTSAAPTLSQTAGKLTFSPAIVVDRSGPRVSR